MILKAVNDYEYDILENDKQVGKAYMYESMASRILSKLQVNYFMELDITQPYAKEAVYQLVDIAMEKRKAYPEHNARVYHCCFSDNSQAIDFYSSLDGFQADEHMVILTCDLNGDYSSQIEDFTCVEDNLNSAEAIMSFSRLHESVFIRKYYDDQVIDDMKQQKSLKSFGMYTDDIVGNVIVIVDKEQAEIEDLVVSEDHRKKGIARHLMLKALDYLKTSGYKNVELEVWDANKKANRLYESLGFEFDRVTEVSIGRSI